MSPTRRRSVARALSFDSQQDSQQQEVLQPPVFSASPVASSIKKMRCRRAPPIEVTAVRRSERTASKADGFHSQLVLVATPRPEKRARKQSKKGDKPEESEEYVGAVDKEGEKEDELVPRTPLHVMQVVGIQLGIDPAKLTKEKLMAAPHFPGLQSTVFGSREDFDAP